MKKGNIIDSHYLNKKDKTKTQVSNKGVNKLNANMEIIRNQEITGFRELRNNLSDFIGKAISNFEEIISGNVKKGGDTVSIISTDLLDHILNKYSFNLELSHDVETNQYEAIVDEINVYSVGKTEDEAIDNLIDLVIGTTADYFDNIELNARIPEMKEKYGYFLRLNHCNNREEIQKMIKNRK